MRGTIADIIKEILEDGTKTPSELKEATKRKVLESLGSFSDQNYHYHLKKLISRGEIKKVPTIYDLTRVETDEVYREVHESIAFIQNKEEDEGIIHSKIRRLRLLSQNSRVADLEFIDALEECLENPKITNQKENFEEFINLLSNILRLERSQKTSKQIVLKITNEILTKIIILLKKNSEFPGNYVISFLCETGKEEAINVLFEKIKEYKDEMSTKINDIGHILKGTGNSKQLKIIKKNIYGLIRSNDNKLKYIGKKFDSYVCWSGI